MEDLILAGLGIPLTPWTVINGDKLVPLLDRIRENLPEEIQQARKVLDRREEILADAQQRASQILQDSKRQAEVMLSESELLRAVHVEADRIKQQITIELEAMRKKAYEESEAMRAQAYEEARTIREGADQYAEAILGSLDKSVSEFQTVIRNGQKYLKRTRAEAAGPQHPHRGAHHQVTPGPISYNVSTGYGSQPGTPSTAAPVSSTPPELFKQPTTGV